jgi:hypothetical protein
VDAAMVTAVAAPTARASRTSGAARAAEPAVALARRGRRGWPGVRWFGFGLRSRLGWLGSVARVWWIGRIRWLIRPRRRRRRRGLLPDLLHRRVRPPLAALTRYLPLACRSVSLSS